jgi:glycerate 2-kinase
LRPPKVSDPDKVLPPDLKQVARAIFDHALERCSIERAFDRSVRLVRGTQDTDWLLQGGVDISLGEIKHLRIIAAGKAAAPMLASLLDRLPLPATRDVVGVLIAPVRPPNLTPTFQFFPGGHPVPNQASFAGASAAVALLRNVGNSSPGETLCVFLISGGASSMMELPLDPSVTLRDTAVFHQALVDSGATITEINCVRKHFSAVKGGRLALAAGNVQKLTLLVSDVPVAHLDALGSGPTIPDPTTVAECRAILATYHLLPSFPTSVQRFFESPNLPETPKPGTISSPVVKLIDSDELAEMARSYATELGFHVVIDNTCDDWVYDLAADYLLKRLRQLRLHHPRVCLISAGEVTVPLGRLIEQLPSVSKTSEASGVGGRNQHFALYIATRLRPDDPAIAVLSAGTDGIDGNSNAAGAIVDRYTIDGDDLTPLTSGPEGCSVPRRTSALQALKEFNSSTWLTGVGATIVIGPTGHNLRDLRILLSD